jgi:hypothetical protein
MSFCNIQGDYPGSGILSNTVIGFDCMTEITIPIGIKKEVCNSTNKRDAIPIFIIKMSNNLAFLLEEKK